MKGVDLTMGIRVKKEIPTTTIVVQIPDSQIDRLKTLIPAYATTVPTEISGILWQVFRSLKGGQSP